MNADDLDLAARIMVAGLRDVLNQEDRATLDRWLNLLPEAFIQRHPWLLMMKALAFQFSWRISVVGRLLGQIAALLDEGEQGASFASQPHDPQILRGLIALLQGQQEFARGARRPLRSACCEEALRLLPEGWRYARGGAILYWGVSMRAIGQSGRRPNARYSTSTSPCSAKVTDTRCASYLQSLSTPSRPAISSRQGEQHK